MYSSRRFHRRCIYSIEYYLSIGFPCRRRAVSHTQQHNQIFSTTVAIRRQEKTETKKQNKKLIEPLSLEKSD